MLQRISQSTKFLTPSSDRDSTPYVQMGTHALHFSFGVSFVVILGRHFYLNGVFL